MITNYIASKWILLPSENKTPKYYLVRNFNESPLFTQRWRDGRVSLYLHDSYKRNEEHKQQTPKKFLQGKNGINITGLKFVGGGFDKLCSKEATEVFAFGEASQKKFVSGGKRNYMYPHKNDAYLFEFGGLSETPQGLLPTYFYFVIIPDCRNFAQTLCTEWAKGNNDELEWLVQGLETSEGSVCI